MCLAWYTCVADIVCGVGRTSEASLSFCEVGPASGASSANAGQLPCDATSKLSLGLELGRLVGLRFCKSPGLSQWFAPKVLWIFRVSGLWRPPQPREANFSAQPSKQVAWTKEHHWQMSWRSAEHGGNAVSPFEAQRWVAPKARCHRCPVWLLW